jgi:hypothetical protein
LSENNNTNAKKINGFYKTIESEKFYISSVCFFSFSPAYAVFLPIQQAVRE